MAPLPGNNSMASRKPSSWSISYTCFQPASKSNKKIWEAFPSPALITSAWVAEIALMALNCRLSACSYWCLDQVVPASVERNIWAPVPLAQITFSFRSSSPMMRALLLSCNESVLIFCAYSWLLITKNSTRLNTLYILPIDVFIFFYFKLFLFFLLLFSFQKVFNGFYFFLDLLSYWIDGALGVPTYIEVVSSSSDLEV